MERYKAQDKELQERRARNREQGVAQLELFGKVTSGKLYKKGIVSVNDANLIAEFRVRKKKQEQVNYDKECKAYAVANKKYESGKVLMDKVNDKEEYHRKFVLTNSALENLFVWKWGAKPKNEREKVTVLKGKSKKETRQLNRIPAIRNFKEFR